MKLPALLASDLHLVASPSAAYRWGLFPWLAERIVEHKVRTLALLGDLTDAKDNHPAELVNQIVTELSILKKKCPDLVDIIINSGNHDWLKAGHEFFAFLNLMPGIRFVTRPWEQSSRNDRGEASAFFLPYSKNPVREWQGLDLSHYEYVFMHQTIKGAIASNGQEMEGEELPDLSAPAKVYSGDIHVPQVIGDVEYVGSPYHVHFGDNFIPRCVLLKQDRNAVDLHFETISRVTVRASSLRQLMSRDLREGDQVKLRMELDASELHDWSKIKREAAGWLRSRGVEVHAIELVSTAVAKRWETGQPAARVPRDPASDLLRFVEDEGLGGHALDAGLELL